MKNNHIYEHDKPITIVTSKHKEDDFIKNCEKLYLRSKISNNVFCGIDFEFNTNWKLKTRYISLMQIILVLDSKEYYNKDVQKPVYLIDLLKMNKTNLELFVKYILCSNVVKIFHGSESLDYPHIFSDVMKNNKRRFMKFLNSSVDTRFLCEIAKRLGSRLGIKFADEIRCSLYYALINHDVIDRTLFDVLQRETKKINYNKPWIVTSLTSEQIKYASYDVMYLYDLLRSITTKIKPVSKSDVDILSVVNRLYRFHTINRLGISRLSEKSEKVFNNTKVSRNMTKEDVMQLDQKIAELKLCDVMYNDQKIEVFLEDVLSIDTTRKSVMNFLRVYKLDHPSDTEYLDGLLAKSKTFNFLKGHRLMIRVFNVVKTDTEKNTNNVKCRSYILTPHH